jgi:hypothetical protein
MFSGISAVHSLEVRFFFLGIFLSSFFFFFSFYCIISTKYACHFSEDCASLFSSYYNMFSGKSVVPSLEVRFLHIYF